MCVCVCWCVCVQCAAAEPTPCLIDPVSTGGCARAFSGVAADQFRFQDNPAEERCACV